MKYNKEYYVGKKIQLYPNDTYSKFGVIKNVDDLGWIIQITAVENKRGNYEVGKEYFISHSTNFSFKFM